MVTVAIRYEKNVFHNTSEIVAILRIAHCSLLRINKPTMIKIDPTVSETVSVCSLKNRECLLLSIGIVPQNHRMIPEIIIV